MKNNFKVHGPFKNMINTIRIVKKGNTDIFFKYFACSCNYTVEISFLYLTYVNITCICSSVCLEKI